MPEVNVAVTDWAALIDTVQVLPTALLQAPPQPVKALPAEGVAVRVTEVPLLKLAEQVLPHEIPAGLLLTVPLPVPTFATDRV